MKKIKKWIAMTMAGLITTMGIMGTASIDVKAEAYWPSNVSVDSGAAVVMEVETGTILYEKNMNQSYYPASITKVMTALLALENCDLDEIITFSETAVYENEGDTSHIAREVGEEMTMESALYGMMLESANECAWAIGEHVGGTMDEFINMMNAKAKELGCTGTHFNNPNGLPDPDHYVTAHDMALIAQAAYKIPKFQELCGTRAYTIPADNKKEAYNCNNTHGMISNHRGSEHLYEYAVGGKTGYTDEAGNTLVTYAKKDGMTLLCVVLNSKNPAHYNDTERLFEYCFCNFSVKKVADYVNLPDLEDVKAVGSLSDKIDLIRIDPSGVVVLPNTASFTDAEAKVSPAKKGSKAVANVEYTYAGKNVGGADIIYEKSKTSSYPFHNLSEEEGGTKLKYFRIDFKTILLVLFIAALLLLVGYVIHLQSGKILLYMHRHTRKKGPDSGKYRRIHRRKSTPASRKQASRSRNTPRSMSGNQKTGKPIQRTRRSRTNQRKRH
ncbi:MAG: D-alanyl-D-alanine carboxypeptidase [Lachnospiraceae bacterium]|nr:D-alanyl-D-alanine carboxypeptidase [Lachnospiraceae bacterium]